MTDRPAGSRGSVARRRRRSSRTGSRPASCGAIAIFVVAILVAIIAHFLLAAVGTLSPSFLFGAPATPSVGGIGPILWNSIYMLS